MEEDITSSAPEKKYSVESPFTNLAFAGAGVLGYAYIGAIYELDKRRILKNIKNFSGSSIGSFVAALLACDATVGYISSVFNQMDIKKLRDDSVGFVRDAWRIYHKYGYCKGKELLKTCKQHIKNLTGNSEYTFGQLYKEKGISLIITASNINKRRTDLFCHNTTPNMPISLAIRISCSYPMVYGAVKFNNYLYIDGGLFLNYPIKVFDESSDSDDNINLKTLGLKTITSDEILDEYNEINNLKGYAEEFIHGMYDVIQKLHIKKDDWKRTIKINTGNLSSMNFNLSDKDKEWLITQGKIATKEFLNSIGLPEIKPKTTKIEIIFT